MGRSGLRSYRPGKHRATHQSRPDAQGDTTMPNTRTLAGTITTLSLMLALAGCGAGNSTPAPGPLAAPQHVQVIPQDGQATIVWDAPDDAKVTGFNVYQGDQKLNDVPIS